MHVVVFAHFFEWIFNPLQVLLQVQSKHQQNRSDDRCSNDVTCKVADHAILNIPFVLMRPQIDKILVCLEWEGHQAISRRCFRKAIRKP